MSGSLPPQFSALPSARNLLNQQAARMKHPSDRPDPDRELALLTTGQIADLAAMQSRRSNLAYDPIAPFDLQESDAPPPPEVGRLQTRLHALKEKLKE
jgi:hypothetical protein